MQLEEERAVCEIQPIELSYLLYAVVDSIPVQEHQLGRLVLAETCERIGHERLIELSVLFCVIPFQL